MQRDFCSNTNNKPAYSSCFLHYLLMVIRLLLSRNRPLLFRTLRSHTSFLDSCFIQVLIATDGNRQASFFEIMNEFRSLIITLFVVLRTFCDRRSSRLILEDMWIAIRLVHCPFFFLRTLFAMLLLFNTCLGVGVFHSFLFQQQTQSLGALQDNRKKRMEFLIFISTATTTTTCVHFSHPNPRVNTSNKYDDGNVHKNPVSEKLRI